MRPPSVPVINRTNPKKYYIEWNHDVPWFLWDKYAPRRRIRIRRFINNRLQGQEREQEAEAQLELWKYRVLRLNYNPFAEELDHLYNLQNEKKQTVKLLDEVKIKKAERQTMSEEDNRKLATIPEAFNAFMDSRRKKKLEPETITSYQGCIDWIYEGLCASGYDQFKISQLRHIHLADALNYIAEDREWQATTINKGIEFMMTVFNWLAIHEYIVKNPSKGKFEKLPSNKNKHRWYDRDTKKKVIEAIGDNIPLLRACQFTYWLLIRSKKELRKLKVGDIDMVLKRVTFSAELSKEKTEDIRDYSPEFGQILAEMKLDQYPKHFYVFGEKNGMPGAKQCGHNYFSKMFMGVKTKLGLSMDYTIYGFKHTRIIHEMMKKTDGYEISYMARHSNVKTTDDYKRDYDFTLATVYGPEDLTF